MYHVTKYFMLSLMLMTLHVFYIMKHLIHNILILYSSTQQQKHVFPTKYLIMLSRNISSLFNLMH